MSFHYNPLQMHLARIEDQVLDCSGRQRGTGKSFFLLSLPVVMGWTEDPKFFGYFGNASELSFSFIERLAVDVLTELGARYNKGHRLFTWPNGARMCVTKCRGNVADFMDELKSYSLNYLAVDDLKDKISADYVCDSGKLMNIKHIKITVKNRIGLFDVAAIEETRKKDPLCLTNAEWDRILARYENARRSINI